MRGDYPAICQAEMLFEKSRKAYVCLWQDIILKGISAQMGDIFGVVSIKGQESRIHVGPEGSRVFGMAVGDQATVGVGHKRLSVDAISSVRLTGARAE